MSVIFKPKPPQSQIRDKLEEMLRLGTELQQYVLEARLSAPDGPEIRDLTDELLKLETRIAIINDLIYQDKMSLSIERAIDRLRNRGISRL